MVGMSWSGTYFWFNWNEVLILKGINTIISDYCYYHLATILTAFVFAILIPRAPYSDYKTDKRRPREDSCSKGCKGVCKGLFKFKILKFSLLSLTNASLTAIYESAVFLFLMNNAIDKIPNNPPLAMPFLVLIAFHGSMFLLGLCQCNRCYKHSEY